MKLTLVFVASMVIANSPDLSVKRTFGLLKDRRTQYEFIPYSPEQRLQVVNTILKVMKIYVNKQSKLDNYKVDPIPGIEEVGRNVNTLSDQQFNYQLVGIFNSFRDIHTQFTIGGPHFCLNNFQAISFTITGKHDQEKIVVKGYNNFDQVKNMSPGYQNIEIGDELLLVGQTPIQRYIKENLFVAGGANEYGGKRRVLERLTFRPGSVCKAPVEDYVTYTFRKLSSSQPYTITLPWVTVSRDDCYIPAKQALERIRSTKRMNQMLQLARRNIPSPSKPLEIPIRFKIKKEAFKSKAVVDAIPFDEVIDYAIYDRAKKNMGIIFIKTFAVGPSGYQKHIESIKTILKEKLQDTNALLLDVRGNPGGSSQFAESIAQLFKQGIEPLKGRMVNHPFNDNLLRSPQFYRPNWIAALKSAGPNQPFSNLAYFTSKEEANQMQHLYKKRVAVLNDAECYSSCEDFSASFQDNQVGLVFGEDGKTGGGGANTVSVNNFLALIDPGNFQPLPYANMMPPIARPDVSVAWLQTVRVGANGAIRLVEDLGVTPFEMIRPNQADLMPGVKAYSVYDTIFQRLMEVKK